MTNFACSACHAVFPAGPKFCPGCGLPLTAQAIATTKPRRRIWPAVFLAIVSFVFIAEVAHEISKLKSRASQIRFLADLNAGKVTSPTELAARCGDPRSMQTTHQGIELRYPTAYTRLNYVVTFAPGIPRFEMEHTDFSNNDTLDVWRDTRTAAQFAEDVGCK